MNEAPPQLAVVGLLAAGLGVERGAVEHHLDLLAARAAGTGAPPTSSPTTVASAASSV